MEIFKLMLPFFLGMLKEYIESSDTTQDDKILGIVKDSANYLADKDNNTLNKQVAQDISDFQMQEWGK